MRFLTSAVIRFVDSPFLASWQPRPPLQLPLTHLDVYGVPGAYVPLSGFCSSTAITLGTALEILGLDIVLRSMYLVLAIWNNLL